MTWPIQPTANNNKKKKKKKGLAPYSVIQRAGHQPQLHELGDRVDLGKQVKDAEDEERNDKNLQLTPQGVVANAGVVRRRWAPGAESISAG